MNATQHKFFNILVQSVADARASAHEMAWAVLGVLLISAILALGLLWVWMLRGGGLRYGSLNSLQDRRAFEDWLGKP